MQSGKVVCHKQHLDKAMAHKIVGERRRRGSQSLGAIAGLDEGEGDALRLVDAITGELAGTFYALLTQNGLVEKNSAALGRWPQLVALAIFPYGLAAPQSAPCYMASVSEHALHTTEYVPDALVNAPSPA